MFLFACLIFVYLFDHLWRVPANLRPRSLSRSALKNVKTRSKNWIQTLLLVEHAVIGHTDRFVPSPSMLVALYRKRWVSWDSVKGSFFCMSKLNSNTYKFRAFKMLDGWGMDWIGLAEDRDCWRASVNAVMNIRFPLNAVNVLTGSGTVSLSRRTLLRGVIYLFIYLFSRPVNRFYVSS